jgi:hypothetical protein
VITRSRSAPSGLGRESGERGRYIRRVILWYGVPFGALVTTWVIAKELPALDHLHTRAGWARLALLVVLGMAEWGIGAGWVVGRVLWYLREHPLSTWKRG